MEENVVTQPTPQQRESTMKGVYEILSSDAAYKKYVPDTYDKFVSEISKSENYARGIHEMVASDEVYSKYLPKTYEETVSYLGLGKPSATPKSASGLATQPNVGQTPSVAQEPSAESPSLDGQPTSPSPSNPQFGFESVVEKVGKVTPISVKNEINHRVESLTNAPHQNGLVLDQVYKEKPVEIRKIGEYLSPEDLAKAKELRSELELNDVRSKASANVNLPSAETIAETTPEKLKEGQLRIIQRELQSKKFAEQAKKGTFLGAMQNSLMEGYTSTVNNAADFTMYLMALGGIGVSPEYNEATNAERAKILSESLEDMGIKKTLDKQLKDAGTTEEYIQQRNIEGGALMEGATGLAGSAFPMMTPQMSGFFINGFVDAKNEIQQEMPDVSPWAQAAYALTQGTVQVALEKVGLSNLVKNKSVTRALTGRIMSEMKSVLGKFSAKEADSYATKVVNAFAAEFETGATQFVVEEGIKQLADALEGDKDAFEFEGTEEFMLNTLKAGVSEGVGGAIMKTISEIPSLIKSPKAKKEAAETNRQTETLASDALNPEVSPQAKVAIEKQIDANAEKVASDYAKDKAKYDSLADDKKQELNSINEELISHEAVLNDPNVSEETKALSQKRIEELEIKGESILDSAADESSTTETQPTNQQPTNERESNNLSEANGSEKGAAENENGNGKENATQNEEVGNGAEQAPTLPTKVFHATKAATGGLPKKGVGKKTAYFNEPFGAYYSTSEEGAKQATGAGEGQRLVEADFSPKNPLVIEDALTDETYNNALEAAREQVRAEVGEEEFDMLEEVEDSALGQKISEAFSNILVEQGYDAVVNNGNGDVIVLDEAVVTEPKGKAAEAATQEAAPEKPKELSEEQAKRKELRSLMEEVAEWNSMGKTWKNSLPSAERYSELNKKAKALGFSLSRTATKSKGASIKVSDSNGNEVRLAGIKKLANPEKEIWSNGAYSAQDGEGGKLEFYDANGDQIDARSKEYGVAYNAYVKANAKEFLGSNEAVDIEAVFENASDEFSAMEKFAEKVIANKNAFEIAENYDVIKNIDENKGSEVDLQKTLANAIGTFTKEDAARYFDKNWFPPNSKWISNEKGLPLDTRIQELIGEQGELTELFGNLDEQQALEMISDLVQAYPMGANSVPNNSQSGLVKEAQDAFKEITGIELNERTAAEFTALGAQLANGDLDAEAYWNNLTDEQKTSLTDEQDRTFTPSEKANRAKQEVSTEPTQSSGNSSEAVKPSEASIEIIQEMDATFEKKGQNFKAARTKLDGKYGKKAKQAIDINRNFDEYKQQFIDAGLITKVEC